MAVDDEIFDLVEGGAKLDLFGIPLDEGAEEAAGGVGALIENVAKKGLTPQPGEFIPSDAWLGEGNEASKAMKQQIKDEVRNLPGLQDVGGKSKEDVMKEHGIYKRRDDGQTFGTREDLIKSTTEKRQARLDRTMKSGDAMTKFKKESIQWFNDQGVNVNDLNLTEEEWMEVKAVSDKQADWKNRADKYRNIMDKRNALPALGQKNEQVEIDKILKDVDLYQKGLSDYYKRLSIGSKYPNPVHMPTFGGETWDDVYRMEGEWLENERNTLLEQLNDTSVYKKLKQQMQGQDDPNIYDMIPK